MEDGLMKVFTLGHHRLGSDRQQQKHLREIHDKRKNPEDLTKTIKKRKTREEYYKKKHLHIVAQGKKHRKLLLKALANNEIDSKWIENTKNILSSTGNPFIKTTDKYWGRINRIYKAHKFSKEKEQKAIDKIINILNNIKQ